MRANASGSVRDASLRKSPTLRSVRAGSVQFPREPGPWLQGLRRDLRPLFAPFNATMTESDYFAPFISGFGHPAFPLRPRWSGAVQSPPSSQCRTCTRA